MKICIICETNPALKGGHDEDGNQKYQSYCSPCRQIKFAGSAWLYRNETERQRVLNKEMKGDVCESCGFVPEHSCQLDCDHIIQLSEGGEHTKENTQTLCANCHRLKTWKERQ